jgi:DNA-binding transcriptional LysR family regulator
MQLTRNNLADFIYFLAVARHLSFSKAAPMVGTSPSALSHAIKALETRLGVRLLNRTTRSVTLTAVGEELYEFISKPIAQIDQAMEMLNRYRDEPAGKLRLNVFSDAAVLVLAPVLHEYALRYPDIEVEICNSNAMLDVVEGGFDAGMRYGATVPEGMVAHRVSPDIRWVVVGSPAYLAEIGIPQHPQDLTDHRCLRFKVGTGRVYDWEFEKDGEQLEIVVKGSVIIDESRLALTMALQGTGLAYLPEPAAVASVEAGELKYVLDDWTSLGPGFYIYYPTFRQQSLALRLLIDLTRELAPLGKIERV